MQGTTPTGTQAFAETVDLEPVAHALVDAYSEGKLIEAPSRTIRDFSKHQALALAERVRELRIAAGHTAIGYKVGFTNAAVREQFDAEGPIAASVYRETLATEPRVDAGKLLGPRIEPEVVLGVGTDGEIAWAALGFEIVQSHVAQWRFGYLDAIADFGLHAALIVGTSRTVTSLAPDALTHMRVRLRCNGQIVEQGAGSDVDGGALGSIAWLRGDLRRVGRRLEPHEIVSTGSMTRVPAITTGERWTLESVGGELPALTIDVE